jgi:hypothetical protein
MPPSILKVKDPDQVVRALVQVFHDAGDEIFNQSQIDCPVDKGTLKSSGVLEKLRNGFRIVYRTSYAARQEFGVEPGTTEEVRRHTVKKHTVRAHTQERKGKVVHVRKHEQPEHERGPFTRTFTEGILGRFFLTNAFLAVKPRLGKIVEKIMDKANRRAPKGG